MKKKGGLGLKTKKNNYFEQLIPVSKACTLFNILAQMNVHDCI